MKHTRSLRLRHQFPIFCATPRVIFKEHVQLFLVSFSFEMVLQFRFALGLRCSSLKLTCENRLLTKLKMRPLERKETVEWVFFRWPPVMFILHAISNTHYMLRLHRKAPAIRSAINLYCLWAIWICFQLLFIADYIPVVLKRKAQPNDAAMLFWQSIFDLFMLRYPVWRSQCGTVKAAHLNVA